MAKLILVVGAVGGGQRNLAGAEFDSTDPVVAQMQSAGAVFVPKELVTAQQLNVLAAKGRGAGAIDPNIFGLMLLASLASQSLKRSFDLTLVAGTMTTATQGPSDLTVGPNTSGMVQLKTPGGTGGARYRLQLTQGAAGSGVAVVTAVDAAGALVNTDTSVVTVTLFG